MGSQVSVFTTAQCSPVQTKVYTFRYILHSLLHKSWPLWSCGCPSLSNKAKMMALDLENTVACFKKNSFHSCQTKNLLAHAAFKPGSGLARARWETVHAEKQPLPTSSPTGTALVK